MLAIIGGTGLTRLSTLAVKHREVIRTPYGEPSAALIFGEVGASPAIFLARHGHGHTIAPHRVNYRANLWALRSLGVRQVLAPCAVGGLLDVVAPGDLVVPDQLVDRTQGRAQTFVDTGAVHVPFADPYCPTGRATAIAVPASPAGCRPDREPW